MLMTMNTIFSKVWSW